MSLCIVCLLRRYNRSQQIGSLRLASSPSFDSDITAETEDTRKFTLSLFVALLPIIAVSASKVLQPVAFTLLLYTISLRVSIRACFHQDHPTVSRFLHVIPLLLTFCVAAVELVARVQSPVLATVFIFLGALPLVTIIIHHGRHCEDISGAGLPVQIRGTPVPAVLGAD